MCGIIEKQRIIILHSRTLKFISRKKGTITADYSHNEYEVLYLIKGEVELTIDEDTEIIKAPIKIEILEKVYRKLFALSDIEIIEDKGGE